MITQARSPGLPWPGSSFTPQWFTYSTFWKYIRILVLAHRNLAYVYLDEGDEVAALRELIKILELVPDDQEARELLESLNF
jgi:hypothetical protein